MSDEESPEEGTAHGGSYNVLNLPPTIQTNMSTSHGMENQALDTDFPEGFKTLQTTSDSKM
jgi:hypothetical protein